MAAAESTVQRLITKFTIGGIVAAAFAKHLAEPVAKLYDTSLAIGTTVKGLYQLEAGFRAVHLTCDDVLPMALRLERALSGVSDSGERTEATFALLGLNMVELRRLDPAKQLAMVATALGQVNAAAAPGLAANLFGRFNAGPALQIARQQDQFQQGMSRATGGGNIMGDMAGAFQRVLVIADQIGAALKVGFAKASYYLIVPIQEMMETIRDIDWAGIGNNIGVVLGGFYEAFREGKLTMLISESFRLGFKSIYIMMPGIIEFAAAVVMKAFVNLGIFLLNIFKEPLDYLQAGMTYVIERLYQSMAKVPGLASAVGIGDNYRADSFEKILEQQKQTGPQFDYGSGAMSLLDMQKLGNDMADDKIKESRDTLKTEWGEVKKAFEPLTFAFKALAAKTPKPFGSDNSFAGIPDMNSRMYKPSANQFERMGFIFNSRGNSGLDYSRRTMVATEGTWKAMNVLIGKKTWSIMQPTRYPAP